MFRERIFLLSYYTVPGDLRVIAVGGSLFYVPTTKGHFSYMNNHVQNRLYMIIHVKSTQKKKNRQFI